MSFLRHISAWSAALVVGSLTAVSAFAQGTTTTSVATVTLFNPLGSSDPRVIIGQIIAGALTIIGSVTLLMFVYGGVLWITSFGEKSKVDKGKKVMVWAVFGLAVIVGAYAIVNAVISGLTTGNAVPAP